jgi:hypothetical protein
MTVVMASRRRAIWAEYIERNNYVNIATTRNMASALVPQI